MAVTSEAITVSTEAVALNAETGVLGTRLLVRNTDDTDTVQLGGEDVTATTGYQLGTEAEVQLDLPAGDVLYAILTDGAAADVDVHVLRLGD